MKLGGGELLTLTLTLTLIFTPKPYPKPNPNPDPNSKPTWYEMEVCLVSFSSGTRSLPSGKVRRQGRNQDNG